MKFVPSKTHLALAAACLLLTPQVMARADGPAHSVYVKGGFLGLGLGYAHSINERFGLRADLTSIGSIKRNSTLGNMKYRAKFQAHQAGAYGDWFPAGNGFRLSVGLHARSMKLDGHAHPARSGNVTIGGTRVSYGGPQDSVRAQIKFPTLAPYLGIGKPKTRLSVSDAVYQRLDLAARLSGSTADAQIAAQRAELLDKANDFKVLPQVYVGISYRF